MSFTRLEMKVFYVPFNNRGLGIDIDEEYQFMEELVEIAGQHHIKKGEEATVFIYTSESDNGFCKAFSKRRWPPWLVDVVVHIPDSFNREEGDERANKIALDNPGDVIVFNPYPSGFLTDIEIELKLKNDRRKWGWSYVVPIEKILND